MRDRSSFHWLSGDLPLSRTSRIVWLACGALHERLPRPRLPVRWWAPEPGRARAELLPDHATPARVLSNLFWESLRERRLSETLGGGVHVLDVGCGRGNYAAILDRAVSFDSYVGIDAEEDPAWSELAAVDERVAFAVRPAEELDDADLAGRNLIVSQSVLEHVRDDLVFFRRVADHLARTQRPLLQIHLLPPANLWRLYGVHGYRGYSERNLRYVVALYPDADVEVIALGGPACNRLHLATIHDALGRLRRRPAAGLRGSDPDRYRMLLAEAIADDAARPPASTLRDATFVALVIDARGGSEVGDESRAARL